MFDRASGSLSVAGSLSAIVPLARNVNGARGKKSDGPRNKQEGRRKREEGNRPSTEFN